MIVNKSKLTSDQVIKLADELKKRGYQYQSPSDLNPILVRIVQDLYQDPGTEQQARNRLNELNELIQNDPRLAKSYTVDAVGNYRHAYEYIKESYADKKTMLYGIQWYGEQQELGNNSAVLETDFLDDFESYGEFNPNHKTLPDEYKSWQDEFDRGTLNRFAINKEYEEFVTWKTQKIDTTLYNFAEPAANIFNIEHLPEAYTASTGKKSVAFGGRGFGSKKSKLDKARKQKKKILNQRNLTQQSILMMNLEELSKLNRDKFRKTGYKNFLCLEDTEPSVTMSKLMSVNFLNISKLKSNHISALIPEMRFYRVDTEINSDGSLGRETGEKEFFFPTFADSDQESRYGTGIFENWKTLISNSSPNIGIRSVEWSNRSGNYLLEKSSIQFNVQMYAERVSDMFAKVVGYGEHENFRYSDLFTVPQKYLDADDELSTQKQRIGNPNYYRLRAKFGWRISDEMLSAIDSEDVREGLKSLSEQTMVVDLSLVNFDLDFAEDGTVTVNATFNSFIHQYMSHNDYSNILISKQMLESLAETKKTLAKLESEKKSNKKPRNQEKIDKLQEKIDKHKDRQAQLTANLSNRYSSIVSQLLSRKVKGGKEESSIRVLTTTKKDVLYRFHTSPAPKTTDDESANKTINISLTHPEYSEFSFLDLSSATESLLYTNNYRGSGILKLVKHKVTKEKRFVYYSPNSVLPTLLPGFTSVLLTQVQASTFFQGFDISDFERDSVAKQQSKNSKDQNAGKSQLDVKKAVALTEDQAEKYSISNEYSSLSKPSYKNGVYNIKYFYLGDLIDVAIDNFVEKTEGTLNLKTVLGSVQLMNYPEELMEDFVNFDVDKETGILSAKESKELSEMAADAGVDANKLRQARKQALVRNAKIYYRNIADIPVSFNSFVTWFYDTYVSKNVANISLDKFIKDVLALAVKTQNSLGDYAYLIPKQSININRSYSSAPKNKKGFDYFGMKIDSGKISFVKDENNVSNGRVNFEDLRYGSFEEITDDGTSRTTLRTRSGKATSFFEQSFKKTSRVASTEETDKYMFLFDHPAAIPPHRIANFVNDSEDGIPHFFLGAASGLVKDVKFSLVDNKLIQADQMLRRPNQVSPKFPIKGRYDCEVTLVGNNFFTPGMVVYINPVSLRLGNPTDHTSPINALGIMGYYMITKVSSYIQAGTYETKVSCKFQSPGNGLDVNGRLAARSPQELK